MTDNRIQTKSAYMKKANDPSGKKADIEMNSLEDAATPAFVESVNVCGITIRLDAIESVVLLSTNDFEGCDICDKLSRKQEKLAKELKIDEDELSWVFMRLKSGRILWLPDISYAMFDFLSWAMVEASTEAVRTGNQEHGNFCDDLYFSFGFSNTLKDLAYGNEDVSKIIELMDRIVREFYIFQEQLFNGASDIDQ